MLRKLSLLLFVLVGLAFHATATHIVGGELIYQHISGNDYQVTLKLYRDCGGGTASLPNSVRMRAFFNSGNDYVEETMTRIALVEVPPVVDTCVIQPAICVQEGIYTDVMTLPPVDGGYHLLFDTGNRNASIDNIQSPLSAGEGFYIQFPDSLFRPTIANPDTLYYEGFDLPDGTAVDLGPTEWTVIHTGSGSADVQSGEFEANNLGGDNVFWTADTIDISGYPGGVTVTMDARETGGLEDDDTLRVTYILDNGPPVDFTTDGLFFNDYTTANPTETGIIGNELIIRIQMKNTSGSESHIIDNVLVVETSPIDTLLVGVNNSPVYNEFPPIFLCVQEPFSFDHSATDADGDSLDYYLCTPYEAWNPSPFSS